MDACRHLPNYQLERRADIFFSLYIQEAIEAKLGVSLLETIVPEFPVRIGTIYSDTSGDKSYKIDYVALSREKKRAVLVELKTDGASRRENQDNYLLAAQTIGMPALLGGILDIFRATNSKRKYFCLLKTLEKMALLQIPDTVQEIMSRSSLQGIVAASQHIEITSRIEQLDIAYIQPAETGPDIINFDEFRDVVLKHNDPISQRFAESLKTWSATKAGQA
jgi:hypothetical protein